MGDVLDGRAYKPAGRDRAGYIPHVHTRPERHGQHQKQGERHARRALPQHIHGGTTAVQVVRFPSHAITSMYDTIQNKVFPFIKNLHGDKDSTYSKYMDDAIAKIPTPQLLEKIVTAMDDINWKDKDIRGDLYEYLLSKIATAGTNGQFRTPRHIIPHDGRA